MTWHVLDIGSIWIKEFTSALGLSVPSLGWSRHMKMWAPSLSIGSQRTIPDPPLKYIPFDLQRGYYRFPIAQLTRFGHKLSSAIADVSDDPPSSPLICTSAFFAPVAEEWRGPVLYYLTDFTAKYANMNSDVVRSFDIRMCGRADAVFPNSERIAQYLVREAACDSSKITVVPNATRTDNIPDEPLRSAAQLPPDVAHLQRPIAGIVKSFAQHGLDTAERRDRANPLADMALRRPRIGSYSGQGTKTRTSRGDGFWKARLLHR